MLPPLLWMICIAVALVLLGASILRIPEGQVYALRRVGGHMRRVGPGTHFVLPLLERIARKISLSGSMLSFDAACRHGRRLRATLYFQVLDAARADAVLDDLGGLLEHRARTLLADSAAPAEPRAQAVWLKQALNAQLHDCGVLVVRVDLL